MLVVSPETLICNYLAVRKNRTLMTQMKMIDADNSKSLIQS